MQKDIVYLDHAATTPLDARVADVMQQCLAATGDFANPASIHVAGRASNARVEKARAQIAAAIGGAPENIIWTSGATESDNLAIQGAARFRAHRGKHLVTMPTEHKAVVDTFRALEKEGFEVTWLVPGTDGLLPPARLTEALREDTQLVSIMHVNNETGVVQDIALLGEICRSRDIVFHTDAAQSVGKLPVDVASWPIDLLSLTAHKFHGPQGIGALYVADRPGVKILPIMFGGGQERRLRPGSLPVHLAVGAGAAAELAVSSMDEDARHAEALAARLWQGIADLPGVARNGSAAHAVPGILNVSAEGVEGESLMLAMEPICVASGSACNSQSGEPSYVLRALGLNDVMAQSAVRFSFGRGTTGTDIDRAIERYRWSVKHLRRIAGRVA